MTTLNLSDDIIDGDSDSINAWPDEVCLESAVVDGDSPVEECLAKYPCCEACYYEYEELLEADEAWMIDEFERGC